MLSTLCTRSFLRSSQSRALATSARQFSSFLGSNEASTFARETTPALPWSQQHVLNLPQFQHPSTPTFLGFAPQSNDFMLNLDNETPVETLEMRKKNRNNRSSKKHKANHGKRPCNRQARRAKKISVGRRSRR